MNKIKFKLKLTGLEMEFEGSRDDMKQFSSRFGQQITGLITPGVGNGSENETGKVVTEDTDADVISSTSNSRKKIKRNRTAGVGKVEKGSALELKVETEKYGSPNQKWSTLDKSLWILYVAESILNIKELSATEIVETFNLHFRQHGKIRGANVSRDFGLKKSGNSALVGENDTTIPTKWFLTEEGKKTAQTLIANQKSNGAN